MAEAGDGSGHTPLTPEWTPAPRASHYLTKMITKYLCSITGFRPRPILPYCNTGFTYL